MLLKEEKTKLIYGWKVFPKQFILERKKNDDCLLASQQPTFDPKSHQQQYLREKNFLSLVLQSLKIKFKLFVPKKLDMKINSELQFF